eukprot:Skav213225  [mRNA]  locus=scaffold514:63076:65775:- [translate_table: standard]
MHVTFRVRMILKAKSRALILELEVDSCGSENFEDSPQAAGEAQEEAVEFESNFAFKALKAATEALSRASDDVPKLDCAKASQTSEVVSFGFGVGCDKSMQ